MVNNMDGSFFIALYDEKSLKLYLKNGIYGSLMRPVFEEYVSSRSKHYAVLADYACSRQGTRVFFFLNRKIYYGGKIIGNENSASFYINGEYSPLGRKAQANLFWDESKRYKETEQEGVFLVGEEAQQRTQPYIFRFKTDENTGKYIVSDDLYFELGSYPFPLPSNSMQGMSFCTLTPGETNILLGLVNNSTNRIDYLKSNGDVSRGEGVLFYDDLVDYDDGFINEAQIEFSIISSLKPYKSFLPNDYVLCRQVPISPFKPMNMDRADICLYDKNDLIKNGMIPNVVIELKRNKANYYAYLQVVRYLKWLERITSEQEFEKITAYVIAEDFCRIKKSNVDLIYENKIKLYSLNKHKFVKLVD